MEYSWDSKLSLQENADKNGVTYGKMNSFKQKYKLKCVQFKNRKLKTLFKREVINFLYGKGFGYEDIARLFKTHASCIWNLRQNGINEISVSS